MQGLQMKSTSAPFPLFSTLFTTACTLAIWSSQAAAASSAPVAVIELFTSVNCPNCPAAERVLDELARDGDARGQRVFALEYHVDYWGRGAKRDPLSDNAFAERQAVYKERLSLEERYTPQMIVNGRSEFIGNERATAVAQVRSALTNGAKASVKLQPASRFTKTAGNAGPIAVEYAVTGALPGADIQVLLVEKQISHRHAGRSFQHHNVVRAIHGAKLSSSAAQRAELTPPASADRTQLSVIVLVQDPRTMAILAAERLELEPETGSRGLVARPQPLP